MGFAGLFPAGPDCLTKGARISARFSRRLSSSDESLEMNTLLAACPPESVVELLGQTL